MVDVIDAYNGSSPRPWGTRRQWPPREPGPGFIPTPVGNTRFDSGSRLQNSVHPHARGEHDPDDALDHAAVGSSPRPWGTLEAVHEPRVRVRFIPTPVGNTSAAARQARCRSVHPHARGEHIPGAPEAVRVIGSSPRPWGTRRRCLCPARSRRFIPTPVGNTAAPLSPLSSKPVHPHARGEHADVEWGFHRDSGSSPRPWGTLTPGVPPVG